MNYLFFGRYSDFFINTDNLNSNQSCFYSAGTDRCPKKPINKKGLKSKEKLGRKSQNYIMILVQTKIIKNYNKNKTIFCDQKPL